MTTACPEAGKQRKCAKNKTKKTSDYTYVQFAQNHSLGEGVELLTGSRVCTSDRTFSLMAQSPYLHEV